MSFSVIKRVSRDSGDGMIVLSWDCIPGLIPGDFRRAPTKSAHRIRVEPFDGCMEPTNIDVIRLPIGDRGDGKAVIKVAALAGDPPDALVYARNGTVLDIDIEPADDIDGTLFPICPEDRSHTLKTLAVISKDAGFIGWLASTDMSGLIDACEKTSPFDVEQAAVEVVLRKIGVHSRSDILRDAIACERAERLIRSYRQTTFPQRSFR